MSGDNRGMHLGHVAKASVPNPTQCAYDGKYVWVTNDGYTKVYEVWANSTSDSGIDPVMKATQVGQVDTADSNLKLPKESTTIGDCGFVTYGGGYVYITLKKKWSSLTPPVTDRAKTLFDCILKVDPKTFKVIDIIRTPITEEHKNQPNSEYDHYDKGVEHQYIMMNSVLHYRQGRLWMVEDYVDALANNGGVQRIWIYNVNTGLWTSQPFAGKMQKIRAQITSTPGFVYITAYNSNSVLKYNCETYSLVSTIKGNANPYTMSPLPDGRVLVASYNGLISHLNTDDTWTHDLIAETDELTCVAYQDANFCWAVDGAAKLFRVGSDNYVLGTKYSEDYKILTSNPLSTDDDLPNRTDLTTSPLWNFDLLAIQGDLIDLQYNSLNSYSFSSTIDYVMVIPALHYQKWNGTSMVNVNQPALVVLLTDSEVVVINTSEIKFGFPRPEIKRSTMSAVGVGMITYGPNDYLGD